MYKNKLECRELSESELNAYGDWEKYRLKSISNHIVEYFPSVMFFHTMIVSLCAIRAPTDFALTLTLFAMLMKYVAVFGYYMNKKVVYIGSGAIEVFINFILLFIAMGYNQHNS